MDLHKKIKEIPTAPGVYMMKSAKGEILYIGKAANLRSRIRSYFQARAVSPRIQAMLESTSDIDCMITGDEGSALLLESALIKMHRPKYNVALRDDKNYPLLKLTINEKYPRVFITRRRKDDGALYFGPYTEAKLLRKALAFLRCSFPMRTCKTLPKSLCLNYYLKQCPGPCVDKISQEGYRQIVNQLILFLEGKRTRLLDELQRRMLEASRKRNYEDAARLRDQIISLTKAVVAYPSRYNTEEVIDALKRIANLRRFPERIEAFDVSNIMGKWAVGSMITFINGKPAKAHYRRFRIKTISKIDDYGMMREIIRRRFENLKGQNEPMPDLVIIDGGKGHLSAAESELKRLGFDNIALLGIAKEYENIYIPGRKEPIRLAPHSKLLYFIQNIRNEAHRFALSYHGKLRERSISVSELDGIKGIGPKKKSELIKYFGSTDGIRGATTAELMSVRGISQKLAKAIKARLR